MEIRIREHRVPLAGPKHSEIATAIKPMIEKAVRGKAHLRKVTMYNLDGMYQNYQVGNQHDLIIFHNATFKGASEVIELEENPIVNGKSLARKKFLPPLGADGNVIIESEEGLALAEFSPDKQELNILFDLFYSKSEQAIKLFEYIMDEFYEKVVKVEKMLRSWKNTPDRDRLISQIKSHMNEVIQRSLHEDKGHLQHLETELTELTKRIRNMHAEAIKLRRNIENEESASTSMQERLMKDFDSILSLDKVKDLNIDGDVITISTTPLTAFDKHGNEFIMGEYDIKLNPRAGSINYFGGTPRRGYWTDRDPHPHVNGRSGAPCLGSLGSTVGELSAKLEVYALTVMAIDFLENVNIDDPAGARVGNWDKVQAEQAVQMAVCESCNQEVEASSLEAVYDYFEAESQTRGGERRVCESCKSEKFPYNEDAGAYVEQVL